MADESFVSLFWPADNPAITAHINLLQGIINRLAGNSASCKTWCLTLVGALVTFAGATRNPAVVTFALVPVAIFGLLDTMYLAQEEAYRSLFNQVVKAIRNREYRIGNVFEATATIGISEFFNALISWSVLPVYLGLTAMYLVARWQGWLEVLTSPRS